jgi:hypothetical protein
VLEEYCGVWLNKYCDVWILTVHFENLSVLKMCGNTAEEVRTERV